MNMQTMLRRQQTIGRELTGIHFMQKGTISHQRVPSTRGGAQTGAMRGPYPVLTWKEGAKTRSLRLKNKDEVAWAEKAVGNHRHFAALCREYRELGERIAHELRLAPKDTEMAERVKRGLKSRSNKAGK